MTEKKLISISPRDIDEIIYSDDGDQIGDLKYSSKTSIISGPHDFITSTVGRYGHGGYSQLITETVELPRLIDTNEKIFWIQEVVEGRTIDRCVLVDTMTGYIYGQRYFIIKYKDKSRPNKYLYPETVEEYDEIFRTLLGLKDYNSSNWLYYEL